ncbi:MAG: hypothetical protein KDA27_28810, partial [Candidatus Eisenbacteria bacterium]|nr:hypothetical protein [Candidatus Eisenbacteria bacterium]
LYTVPGQVYYNATRKLVLKGVDAVVFVADSKRGKMDENVESLENLKENLREHGLDVNTIPWVLQYNKRDLPEVYSIQELDQVLNPMKVPTFEAVATNGNGVIDTFKGVSRLLLKKLSAEVGVPIVSTGDGPGAGVGTAPASSGAPQGGTAAKAPNQLAQLQTPQPPTAPPQAPSTQPARPVATSAAQTPSTSTDEANTPPISRSSAPPVSNAASPSTPPSTPPSSTGQSPQAASSGSRSLGGITRSDGSSSD